MGRDNKEMEQTQEQKKVDFKNLSGGLEILVQLAEKKEIDPWDIDIIELTNKYLAALNSTPRENLLNAGRAIFYASVLLRLKSEILLNISNETLLASQEMENFFPEDDLLDQDGVRLDLSKLESFLVRSSLCKQQRKRAISLPDLIFALQQAEEEEERRSLRAKLKAQNAFRIIAPETPDDIMEFAQEEDVDEIVEKIEAIIEEHLTSEKPITLGFLSGILSSTTRPFIALLFLAHSQKVVLEQKEMYGEVFIYKGGTVLEEKIEPARGREGDEAKKEKKKNIVERIKDKISRKKKEPRLIEITTHEKEITDIAVIKPDESEVVSNGNNNTTE